MRELIERQAAIDAIHCNIVVTGRENAELVAKTMGEFVDRIKALPTIQPEPSIPLSWIENEIKWLKSLDNTFSEITALQISAMVNKWRDEKK